MFGFLVTLSFTLLYRAVSPTCSRQLVRTCPARMSVQERCRLKLLKICDTAEVKIAALRQTLV